MPCRECPVGVRVKELDDEDGGSVRKGFVRATRGTYDCEPDGVADRVRQEPRYLEVPQEWVFEDEGFYEKVVKVKADVAALLIFFSDIAVTSRMAWRVVKGAVFWRSS